MSDVVVLRTSEEEIENNVARLFEMAGGIGRYVDRDDRVLIKPNFIAPRKSSTGATTNLTVIEGIIKCVLGAGAVPIIGEGVPYAFDADETFRRLGVDRLAEKYHIDLVNLDKYPSRIVEICDGLILKEVVISNFVFEVDKIINVPIMKTHTQTTVTLGMKNLKGCIPGKEKLHLHNSGLHKGIVDLNTVIKPTFTIIDGIVAMEGKGPTNGDPKRMNLLLGSSDILALEIIGAKIMGFDPYSISHIRLSQRKDIGEYDLKKINVRGEAVKDVRDKFAFPASQINKLIGSLFLGQVMPFLARCGIDITNISQRLMNYSMPYPVFMDKCEGCGNCIINCPKKAIGFEGKLHVALDKKKCSKCYVCDEVCIYNNVKIEGR